MTLMEALLASTMLSMGASAVLLPFNVGAQAELEDHRRTLALYLGREIMEEAIAKPFDDPDGPGALGPDAGESSRALFDNIDDYHNYKDGHRRAINQILGVRKQTIDGVAMEGLERKVLVEYVHVNGQDLAADPNFVSVTVRVKYEGNLILTLRRLVHKPE